MSDELIENKNTRFDFPSQGDSFDWDFPMFCYEKYMREFVH